MEAWLQTAVLLTVATASVVYVLLLVYRRATARSTLAAARGPHSDSTSKTGHPTKSSAARLFRGDSAADSALHSLAQPKSCYARVTEAEEASTRGCSPVQLEGPVGTPVQV
jgi:hypothetical protein